MAAGRPVPLPAEIAKEFGLAARAGVYSHGHAMGLFGRRHRNILAALEKIAVKTLSVKTAKIGKRSQSGPKFARQMGIKSLYHYEKFNACHLSITLRDQKIHCSNPANLNDPWDCKPWLDDLAFQNRKVFMEVMAYYHRQSQAKGTLRPDLEQRLVAKLRDDPKEQAKFLDGQSKSIQGMVSKRRIYCVTPDPESVLMWAHYADNHRGICLEFSVANPLFSQALQVLYTSEYPLWLPHEFETQQERTAEMILTKAEEWRYEKEFRLISILSGPETHWLRTHDDFFSLPPGALKSVIAGCQADYDAVKAIVKMHIRDLPVKRAVRVPNHYRLTIES